MSTSLFVKLSLELARSGISARTEESRKWFMNRVRKINRINEVNFIKDPSLIRKQRFFPGYMYHFIYDAKNKDALPYYDTFPLVIAVKPAPGGFYGMNLHYLHPMTRALFLDKLLDVASKTEFDEKTRFKLNYSLVSSGKRFKEFKPCFKHYLFDQIESKLMMVPSQEWETAIFLPTEKFEGAKKQTVWRDSKQKILK